MDEFSVWCVRNAENSLKNLLPTYPMNEKIRLLRLFSGLSQSALAKKLEASQAWLSKVEAGRLEISARHLLLLRTIFEITCDEILDGSIPYLRIAMKMNPAPLIPEKYVRDAYIPISCIYPFIESATQSSSTEALEPLAKIMNFRSFILSDPQLLVNEAFLDEFLSHASNQECWSSPSFFEVLKKNLSFQNPALFEKSPLNSQMFDSEFILKVKSSISALLPEPQLSRTSRFFHQL